MPRRLMDNLEGEVADEEVHKSTLGYDILSDDLNGEDALLLNIRKHCVFGVAHNVSCFICGECIGKVPKPRFNVVSECILALVRNGDVALGYSHSIHRMMVMDHHRCFVGLALKMPTGISLRRSARFFCKYASTSSSRMAYRCVLVGRMRHGMMPLFSIHAAFRLLI